LFGKTDKLDFDDKLVTFAQLGAITRFDKSSIESNEIVDVTILTNNINKIQETVERIAERFGLQAYSSSKDEAISNLFSNSNFAQNISSNELQDEFAVKSGTEIKDENILSQYLKGEINSSKLDKSFRYNQSLLTYAGILDNNTFTKNMLIAKISAIFIIMAVSIIVIYTSFKMTYSERIREFGVLKSIGMDDKQKKLMIKKEEKIFGAIRNNCWVIFRNLCFKIDYRCN
jgi:ABC-type antimicrobial peptide transport system permease subunit